MDILFPKTEDIIISSSVFIKLIRNEIIAIRLPLINSTQSLLNKELDFCDSSCRRIINDKTIIDMDKMIGVTTGPTHGTGIKNKISGVRNDSGQSISTFRKM